MCDVDKVRESLLHGVEAGGRRVVDATSGGFALVSDEETRTRVILPGELFHAWTAQLAQSVGSHTGRQDSSPAIEDEVASLMMLQVWEAIDAVGPLMDAPSPERVFLVRTCEGRIELTREFTHSRRGARDPLAGNTTRTAADEYEWRSD